MNSSIVFVFEGKKYTAPDRAYELNRIVLPDNRILEANGWLESDPPMPIELHDTNNMLSDPDLKLTSTEVARYVNGVVAEEIQ